MSKDAFHRNYKRILRQVAAQMGLAKGTFDVRSNKGGDGILGEVVLHGERIYVHVGGSSDAPLLYYRRVDGRKDYIGGANQWDVTLTMLNENRDEAVRRFITATCEVRA